MRHERRGDRFPTGAHGDDSRTRRDAGTRRAPGLGELSAVYCVSCHRLCGWTGASTYRILYVCDACFRRYGGLPLPRAPDRPLVPPA
jgi:hypothetical protein